MPQNTEYQESETLGKKDNTMCVCVHFILAGRV